MLRDVGGLQAQLLDAAALGIRARSLGLRRDNVDRALREERTIVRTWLMRGTIHVVAEDDLRWLLGIFGPVFSAADRARHTQLGLTDDLKARGVRAIRRILAEHGPRSMVPRTDNRARTDNRRKSDDNHWSQIWRARVLSLTSGVVLDCR